MVSAICDFSPFALPYGQLDKPAAGTVDLWLLPLLDLAPPLTQTLQHDANPESAAAQRLTRKMLLRLLLAAYLRVPAREIRLSREVGGKPYISRPVDCGLNYSVSYCLDYVLVAISTAGRLGVDLEPLSRFVRNPLGVARRYFAPPEYDALSRLRSAERCRRAFLRLWTRKEAVVKATGGGIVSGLSRFAVEDDDFDEPRVVAMVDDDPANWHLLHLEPVAGLVGTLATDRPLETVRAWRVTPPVREVAELHRRRGSE